LLNRVRITGFLRGETLARALAEISVIIMPSVWEETAGLAAIDQMSRGRLVIASAIGGLRKIVDEVGLFFPPGDAVALAESMRSVIDDPSLIDSLGQSARRRALQLFQRERMIRDHAEACDKLVRGT
jgi:glycosyltransferase involved in cell wall biosynthesis